MDDKIALSVRWLRAPSQPHLGVKRKRLKQSAFTVLRVLRIRKRVYARAHCVNSLVSFFISGKVEVYWDWQARRQPQWKTQKTDRQTSKGKWPRSKCLNHPLCYIFVQWQIVLEVHKHLKNHYKRFKKQNVIRISPTSVISSCTCSELRPVFGWPGQYDARWKGLKIKGPGRIRTRALPSRGLIPK